ncbi:immunity 63 family protein [Paenibacillus lautus]|uniref:immunity 63 family protein n=1 Tax=Paenibacillus lautus TaxID=1401 RepID=UPI003D290ADD
MSNMLTKQEMIDRILHLLHKTSMYDSEYERVATLPFEEGYIGDLSPVVRVGEQDYELAMYERGVQMLSKRTKDTDEVIFWILEDTIHTIAHIKLLQKYKVDNVNTHLKYTKDEIQEMTDMIHESFLQIGGQYEEWHKAGKRKELESPNPGRNAGKGTERS